MQHWFYNINGIKSAHHIPKFWKSTQLKWSSLHRSLRDSIWPLKSLFVYILQLYYNIINVCSLLLTSPWYLKESYTLRMKSQKGQRYSNLNSSTKSASSTSAHTTRNFRYRKVLKNEEREIRFFYHKHTLSFDNNAHLYALHFYWYIHADCCVGWLKCKRCAWSLFGRLNVSVWCT